MLHKKSLIFTSTFQNSLLDTNDLSENAKGGWMNVETGIICSVTRCMTLLGFMQRNFYCATTFARPELQGEFDS